MKRLAFAALCAFVGVLILTLLASTSRIDTRMTVSAAPHTVDRCHPTQHGDCWFFTCCLPRL